ncbi:GNAT family N-acetyltransferase [Nocardioides sp. C4-1]|uniref:GNAT family N-acetyltransferase n=1 Tax=Nocardioides sp. C4-1 TaxID=3151851 RepID=UPI0032675247
MHVRLARPADLERLGEITVAAYADFTHGPDDTYVARLRDTAARADQAELWVAVHDDGRLLGSVTNCPPGSPWREIARDDEGEFRMLAVDPSVRRTGAGRALVEHVEERWRAAGATGIALSSLADMTAAHALYARLGFTRDPTRDWSPHDGVDLLAFTKALR